MALRLYNTMSAKVEEFRPLQNNEVRMYSCGPTVYDYGHIGNFRTFVAVDILRRFFRQSGYKLRHAMNITDVDDKIIRNSAHEGVSVKQYTAKYEKAFLEDSATLNIEHPILTRATDHILQMAEFIAKLEQKGLATANFPKKILREWKTVRGLMWTSTKKITHATSRCGKRRRRGKRHGRARLGAAARVGTLSAR